MLCLEVTHTLLRTVEGYSLLRADGSYSLLWSKTTQFVEADSLLLTTELKSLYDDKILLLLQIFTFQSGNIDYIR